jgi:cysteine desulfurase / selenocysteine lyase
VLEAAAHIDLQVERIRAQFPILHRTVHGSKPLVYLDNAATTQKPQSVIDAIGRYYTEQNSNVHRGAHALSAEATSLYEKSRRTVAGFLNARSADEIVFTKGTTESINLVAQTWGVQNVNADKEILVSVMEHHANIVPWQMLSERVGATLRVIPIHDDGSLDMDAADAMLTSRTALLAITHVSNTTGVINPIAELCQRARERGVTTLVDGAQAVLHEKVDVQQIGCDFYAFSAHKLFGPTGIGVLYGRKEILDTMPPYQGGGSMISRVSFEGTTFNDVPVRFEAGTPHIAGAIGMDAAITWFSDLDIDAVAAHERALLAAAMLSLENVDGLIVLGTTPTKIPVISFTVEGIHGHDIGTLLDEQGVAVRTGHHCTMPLMERLGVGSTCRASFALYNTMDDVEQFTNAVVKAVRMLR